MKMNSVAGRTRQSLRTKYTEIFGKKQRKIGDESNKLDQRNVNENNGVNDSKRVSDGDLDESKDDSYDYISVSSCDDDSDGDYRVDESESCSIEDIETSSSDQEEEEEGDDIGESGRNVIEKRSDDKKSNKKKVVYEKDKSKNYIVLDSSSDEEEEEEEVSVKAKNQRGKGESVENGNDETSTSDSGGGGGDLRNFVGESSRSHNDVINIEGEDGDEDDDEEEEEEEEDEDEEDNEDHKIREKVKKLKKCPAGKEKGKGRGVKGKDAQRIHLNSMLNLEKSPKEDALCGSQTAAKTLLAQQFTFGGNKSTPPEKSEAEKELDDLFAEMEFSQRLNESGSSDLFMEKEDLTSSDEDEDDDVAITGYGNHDNCNNIGRKGENLKENMKMKNVDVNEDVEDDDDDDDDEDYVTRRKVKKLKKSPIGKEKDKGRGIKGKDAQRILLNSILNLDKTPIEDALSSNQITDEISLAQHFTFGSNKSTPPEKSEAEKELDDLFAEMEFSQRLNGIRSTDSSLGKEDFTSSDEGEVDQATLCRRGKHNLVLDEEIGIKCISCPHLQTEIRYVTAPFATRYGSRSSRWDPTVADDNSLLRKLQNHGSNFDANYNSSSNAQGTVWDLVPGVKNNMYDHQIDGFEFIWRNVAGEINLDKLRKSSPMEGGNGCLISHAPGTGKTRLTIVFLQAYMKLYPMCRPVIIAPCSMLLTWEDEFKKWKVDIPVHNLGMDRLSGKENKTATDLLWKGKDVETVRAIKLYSWRKDTSVLVIGYNLFQQLVGRKSTQNIDEVQMRTCLLESPGPFVFDEGHIARNERSFLYKALSEIKTRRRIILSGTLFQNTFEELFSTICLARPDLRGSRKKYGCKRNKGDWKQLFQTRAINAADGSPKNDKFEEIRKIFAPLLHQYSGKVLKDNLFGLRHYVLLLKPENLQKSLLAGQPNTLKLNCPLTLVAVHPSLLENAPAKLEKLRLNPEAGIKTRFLKELLHLSDALKERVLVFSQYLEPLALIKDQLKSQFKWSEGHEILYIDGDQELKQRQSSINALNDPLSEAKVLLASIEACCEGINLVGASRVVLLDVSWNPSVPRQAISRAYRLGQKKVVYVYQLVTSESMEVKKFYQQLKKDQYSSLLFGSSNEGDENREENGLKMEDKILEEMKQHDKLRQMFEQIKPWRNESKFIDSFVAEWNGFL